MVKEKPIIFSTEMVKAILDRRKTMTRRVIKPQPTNPYWCGIGHGWDDGHGYELKCPYQVGDVLWVRETWYYEEHMHEQTTGEPDLPNGKYSHRYIYKADNPGYPVNVGVGARGWRPSIHMPRVAARLFLEVVSVRVEQVQDITLRDILCEGIEAPDCRKCFEQLGTPCCKDEESECGLLEEAFNEFKALWDSIYAKKGYGIDASPWVWVYEFRRIDNYA